MSSTLGLLKAVLRGIITGLWDAVMYPHDVIEKASFTNPTLEIATYLVLLVLAVNSPCIMSFGFYILSSGRFSIFIVWTIVVGLIPLAVLVHVFQTTREAIREERELRPLRPLVREFKGLYLQYLLEAADDQLSVGQSPDAKELGERSAERAAAKIIQEHHLTQWQINKVVDLYIQSERRS